MTMLSMAEFDERFPVSVPPRGAVHRKKQLAQPAALGQATDPEPRDAITADEIIEVLGQYGYTMQSEPIPPDDQLTTIPAGELERSHEEGGADFSPDLPEAEHWPEQIEVAESWEREDISTAAEPDFVMTDAELADIEAAEIERIAAEQRAAEQQAAAEAAAEELVVEPLVTEEVLPPMYYEVPEPEEELVVEEELAPPPKPSILPIIGLAALALVILSK